jgi:acetyl esterase/lipase
MNSKPPRYEAQLQQYLDDHPEVDRTSLTPEKIAPLREAFVSLGVEGLVANRNIEAIDWHVRARDGHQLAMTTIQKKGSTTFKGAIFHIHSGGMIAGDRFIGMEMVADWVEEYDLIATTVEYRLSPQFQDPIPVQDCFDALKEFASQIDSIPLIVLGMSAGGGLSAGVAHMAKDLNGPRLAGQLLMCPMLDESNSSASSKQFSSLGMWDRESNDVGWDALLGDRRHTDNVSHYASAAKAKDLSNLPPTFLDTGVLEVFRSEIVDYAERLAIADVPVELHMWSGAFHGFDLSYPDAEVSKLALNARKMWLERLLKGHMR